MLPPSDDTNATPSARTSGPRSPPEVFLGPRLAQAICGGEGQLILGLDFLSKMQTMDGSVRKKRSG